MRRQFQRVGVVVVVGLAAVGVVALWLAVGSLVADWRFLHSARLMAEQQAQQRRAAPAPTPAPTPTQAPTPKPEPTEKP